MSANTIHTKRLKPETEQLEQVVRTSVRTIGALICFPIVAALPVVCCKCCSCSLCGMVTTATAVGAVGCCALAHHAGISEELAQRALVAGCAIVNVEPRQLTMERMNVVAGQRFRRAYASLRQTQQPLLTRLGVCVKHLLKAGEN